MTDIANHTDTYQKFKQVKLWFYKLPDAGVENFLKIWKTQENFGKKLQKFLKNGRNSKII